jgi:hypothetical protein
MLRSQIVLGFLLSAVGLTGLSSPVVAGGTAGRSAGVSQINPVITGVGTAAGSGFGTTQGLNVSVQPSVGSVDAAGGSIAPATTSPNTTNVQTNIDNSKTIDASNNINVTDTVNGSNVSYGGNGASINWPQANVLGVIDGVASFNQSISANSGPNVTAITDALDSASFLAQQGN